MKKSLVSIKTACRPMQNVDKKSGHLLSPKLNERLYKVYRLFSGHYRVKTDLRQNVDKV